MPPEVHQAIVGLLIAIIGWLLPSPVKRSVRSGDQLRRRSDLSK